MTQGKRTGSITDEKRTWRTRCLVQCKETQRTRDGWARKMARADSAKSSQVVAYGMTEHCSRVKDRP